MAASNRISYHRYTWRNWKKVCSYSLLLILAFLVACHADPNVRKQKYFESGNRYAAKGKYKEAAIQYANAVKVDKNYAPAHYELAKTYMHLGELRGAYAELLRTVDLQPSNVQARLDLGNLYLWGGKLDEAQAQGKEVLAAAPDNPDVYGLLSSVAMRRGQIREGFEQIHRALELDPQRAQFHEQLAILTAKNQEDPGIAETEFKRAVSLDPKSMDARLLLAAFYGGKDRWREAEQTLREAIAMDPKNLAPRKLLADICLKKGDSAAAEGVLRQAQKDLANDPQGQRVLADYYLRSGESEKARAELSALVAANPKNPSLKQDYVRILLQLRDYAAAQTVIDSLLKGNPKDPQVRGLQAILLLNSGKLKDALTALQASAREYPTDPFLQFWLGEAARANGDVALAKTSFARAAAQGSLRLNALAELAAIAAQTGDTSSLTDVAAKAIAIAPNFANAYVWRGTGEASRQMFAQAEQDYRTAMKLKPEAAAPYLQLGKLRIVQKRAPEAVVLLEQALDRDPGNIEAVRLLVSYDVSRGQVENASVRVKKLIAELPNKSGLYDLLAELQAQQKNFDRAAETAKTAMELNPADGEAFLLFAQIQIARGHMSEAVESWGRWVEKHPNDPGALALLGTFAESGGDKSKAESYYRKALGIQPQQALAANNLAYMMLEKGENIDLALSLAQTARRSMPNSPNTADTLAWAYYHKAAYSFARDLLEEAVQANDASPTMQYHLGMVYTKLHDKASAATHLRKVISLSPGSALAKDATDALHSVS
jgi:tetratricopeptide (TPR) repeat protein